MTIKTIPVLLLTGYLGSGKTTLLNRILTNKQGIKFAVIVNDIGEVNIDAELIQQGGIVGKKDESLVALQNGCICCTLKMDLVEQLTDITKQHRFDYIVIEASGICEPAPIAQTICSIPSMVQEVIADGVPMLDSIVTVVDALRMKDEFNSGESLTSKKLEEDDIENLIIQQIEFCNTILLNKASEVTKDELGRIRSIIRAIQPKAEIIECDFCDVDFNKLIGTAAFNFDEVAGSASWIKEIEKHIDELDEDEEDEHEHHHHDDECDDPNCSCHHHHHDDDEHEHHHHHDDEDEHEHHHHHHHHDGECDDPHCCCHHHHHHGEGEAEEYGIGTYVYYQRKPFDLTLFDEFVAKRWPKNIIRAKGICYFADETHICYVFEQAGKQVSLRNAGQWYATMPEDELARLMEAEPGLKRDWDETYGDRMQKLVFIGQKLDKQLIKKELDACVAKI